MLIFANVQDVLTVQFKYQSEKKGYSYTEKVKTSKFAANEQNKSTSASTKQYPLKDGDPKIWSCVKVKQQGVYERFETLKKFRFCFGCLHSHLMKDCKLDKDCCVNGFTKQHNKLLHPDSRKPEKDKKSEESLPQNRLQWFLTVGTNFNRKRETKRWNDSTLWYWIHGIFSGQNFGQPF